MRSVLIRGGHYFREVNVTNACFVNIKSCFHSCGKFLDMMIEKTEATDHEKLNRNNQAD